MSNIDLDRTSLPFKAMKSAFPLTWYIYQCGPSGEVLRDVGRFIASDETEQDVQAMLDGLSARHKSEAVQ